MGKSASAFLSRVRPALGAAALIAAGSIAARIVAPTSSHACSCTEPTWSASLLSVQSDAAGPDHSAHWPQSALLGVDVIIGKAYASLSLSDETNQRHLFIGASHE